MYEQAIAKVKEYMDTQLPAMNSVYPNYLFDIRAYSRWAASEIIERLIEEDSKLPPHITGKEPMPEIDIIQDFIDETEYYSCMVTDPNMEKMFTIACNTGKYIKCLFLKH